MVYSNSDMDECDADEAVYCVNCGVPLGENEAKNVYDFFRMPFCFECYKEVLWRMYAEAPLSRREWNLLIC